MFLVENGIKVKLVNKVTEGSPHIVDLLEQDKMSIVINTTETRKSINDSFSLRRTALNRNVPYFLTVSGARAAINSIKRLKSGEELKVNPISDYH
jgi:carbamoyl-phosphate synthase large subunit